MSQTVEREDVSESPPVEYDDAVRVIYGMVGDGGPDDGGESWGLVGWECERSMDHMKSRRLRRVFWSGPFMVGEFTKPRREFVAEFVGTNEPKASCLPGR